MDTAKAINSIPQGQLYSAGSPYTTGYAYDPAILERLRLIKKALEMDATSEAKINLISFVLDAS